MDHRVAELARILRPAAGGIHVVSTGVESQAAVQRRLYGTDDAGAIQDAWRAALERIARARGVLLGVPSDVGAGFVRGANFGPQAVRAAVLDARPDWPRWADDAGLVDLGDVFVVPQLLHDDMLSDAQKLATRRAIYADLPDDEAARLPVSPLSIAERALDLALSLNPAAKVFVIGGDHSCAWPAVSALSRARRDRWAIVQPDAHTDLLAERLGVKYCFATWSYHANELLGRDGRMVQVGIRATRRDREHWESTLGVRQFWAAECLERPAQTLDAILGHLRDVRAESVYFSNDIDGTDASWADATGTPEPSGLPPDFLLALIRRLGEEVGLCGGDIMEVAPPLAREGDRTLGLAARYLVETIAAALGRPA